MTYKDAELLNSSINRLGETLLNNRMLDDRKAEAAARDNLGQQQLSIEQQRMEATTKDADAQTKLREQMLQTDQGKTAMANLQGAYEQITKDYQAGVISKDEANRRAKSVINQVKMGSDLLLKASPFAALLDSEGELFSDNSKPSKDAKEVVIGGRRFAQTAEGALMPLDRDPSRPFSRTVVDPTDPNARVTQRMTAEEYILDAAIRKEAAAQKALEGFTPETKGWFNTDEQTARNAAKKKALQDALDQATARREALQGGKSGAPVGDRAAAANKPDMNAIRAEAQAAIKAGKDPAAVRKRFKELTGEDL